MNPKAHLNAIVCKSFNNDYVKAVASYISSLPVEYQLQATEACLDLLPKDGYNKIKNHPKKEFPSAETNSTMNPKAHLKAISSSFVGDYVKLANSYINSMPVELRNLAVEACFDCVPLGYHFQPTNEALVGHYLFNKNNNEKIPRNIFVELDDIYANHPKNIIENYLDDAYSVTGYTVHVNGRSIKFRKAPYDLDDVYFVTPRYKEHVNGRSIKIRKAGAGYWKATTAPEKVIFDYYRRTKIGSKRSFRYYQGNPPNGIITKWMMQEYIGVGYQGQHRIKDEDMKVEYVLCKIGIMKRSRPRPKGRRRSPLPLARITFKDSKALVRD